MIRPLNRLTHLSLAMSKVRLEHMECLGTMTTLVSLNLSNIRIYDFSLVLKHLSGLKNLRKGEEEEEKRCPIPGLEGRHLEFLGLLGCAYAACSRSNIPATRVTGDANPAQVLLAVQVYLDNQWLLIKALNDLFNFFRFSSVPNHCKALEAILAAMKNFPFDSSVQIAGSLLVSAVEGKEKELVGKMGAVDTMLDIITRKLREDDCDDVLEVAWSTLWNVTDETPSNCQKFLDKNGMDAFVQCLQARFFENTQPNGFKFGQT
nr:hypothetical protein BaRGS_011427 [Batillaria attramentaria]